MTLDIRQLNDLSRCQVCHNAPWAPGVSRRSPKCTAAPGLRFGRDTLGSGRNLASANPFEREASAVIRVVRWQRPSVSQFAREVGEALDRGSLSRQAIYDWESGKSRVPGAALLAASAIAGIPLGELLAKAHALLMPALPPDRVDAAAPAYPLTRVQTHIQLNQNRHDSRTRSGMSVQVSRHS